MPKFIPPLCANELRYLAEKADGWRDTPLTMVITDGKVDVKPTEQLTRDDKALFILDTKSRGEGVAGDAKARVFWRDKVYGGSGTDLEKADAVFLTQSAIEKFLLPYYMRFKSGAEVQGLENRIFNNKNVAAVFHIPPSIPKMFPGPGPIGADGFDGTLAGSGEIDSVGIVGSLPPTGEVKCESFANWCSLVDEADKTRVGPKETPAGVASNQPR
jgi:hypothetical protein